MNNTRFVPVRVACALFSILFVSGIASGQSTIIVNTLDGDNIDNGNCSLYEAIYAADNNTTRDACPSGTGDDTIQFSVTGTIVLSVDLPSITEPLTIQGPGAALLIVDGSGRSYPTLDFYGAPTLVSDIAFSGGVGLASSTGAVVVVRNCVISNMTSASTASAFDVYKSDVTLDRCTVSGNSGSSSGPIYGFGADITIMNSTFSNNSSFYAGVVAAIGNATTGAGMLVIENSTFTGNVTPLDGGALVISGALMTATITSTTISGNTADSDANGTGSGGGIRSDAGATVTIANSVVAGNMDLGVVSHPDVSGSFSSAGYNLIGDCTGSCGDFAAIGDQEGTSASPINPLLAALANNGGPTLTMALSTGSPAIDAGSCTGSPSDQRHFGNVSGSTRIVDVGGVANVDDGCDIGAYEADGVIVLPVELVEFNAVVDERTVVLSWNTISETNNAGFAVQINDARQANFDNWKQVAWVSGHATSNEERRYSYRSGDLRPGTYRFRLKQVDFDGSYSFSDQIEVTVNVGGTHLLSRAYPNPFSDQSRFTLTLTSEQDVRVSVFDVLGRKVATLHQGPLSSGETHEFVVDGDNLPLGLYLIQLTGESFADNLRVVLRK